MQEKEMKGIRIRKRIMKLSLFLYVITMLPVTYENY